ncbi:hypothetical protein COS83_02830 [archaeon CG07_land_8_20_14_0_80_38_8]|nr:MAG: hypothetical protein COS83_02830 [archaeon CG07_land_8_20_14_0_80_38_8]PIU88523.1 MAG: hypothetical protein COS64_03425 [archaeon CG06_land_8_20_14_3_00_37_11]
MNWLIYSLLAMIIQGVVLFLVKLFSFNVHPFIILLYQYIGSIILMLVYLLLKKISFRVKRKQLFPLLFSGFLVSTGLAFYYLALGLETASRVVPLHNVGITVLPVLLAVLFLKEKMDWKKFIGIACSIICIIFLTI